MKTILLCASLLFTSMSFAESTEITGYGSHSELCQAYSNACMYIALDIVQSQGEHDVTRQCELKNGMTSEVSCKTACDPLYIPANTPATWVTCSATCKAICQK